MKHLKELIKEELIFEMASVGMVDGYKIEVWTRDEGDVPHFHVHKPSKDGKEINAPIRFLEAKYFHHGEFKDILKSGTRKKLVKFLTDDNCSKWKALNDLWNNNGSTKYVPNTMRESVPDYVHIEEG